MSSINIDPRTDPTSDVVGLLAHGALVIVQSRNARDRSRQARVCSRAFAAPSSGASPTNSSN
jgi:hypothetical protein